MINLFNIQPNIIDTSKFNHILHGDIVEEFTENFCHYVGVKYGCPVNSASSAIFLLAWYKRLTFVIPSMIPPVVLNSIYNGYGKFVLTDDTSWVGHPYTMYNNDQYKIIDSAQEVKPVNLEKDDIIIYSFYPTKPVGSCDGGMICSNNKELIDCYKITTMNGMEYSTNSWDNITKFAGWKMYMNSIQAYIANESLKKLDEKKEKLKKIREIYNEELGYSNDSEYLYRIITINNIQFINKMKDENIVCGIHYPCTHNNPIYSNGGVLLKADFAARTTASIPYHEKLTEKEIKCVIKCVKNSGLMV